MKVALVHDYLTQYGGAEKVLEALHALYPTAPVYTSIYTPDTLPPHFREWTIRTSFMQRAPLFRRRHQFGLLFYPTAFEQFDFSGYDLVISSSSAWAKGVITGPRTTHVTYCHAPMRFVWQYDDYLRGENVGPLGRLVLPFLMGYVRLWDEVSARRPDAYAANSLEVARRIKKYYHRPAQVINPPVELANYAVAPAYGDYFLIVSRLVPYKRLDIVIEAFNHLGLPLKVVGRGRQRAELEAAAGPNIQFLGAVDQTQLRRLYAECQALIWPEAADFGIAPVEVQASGRPVIAYAAGGALETVVAGETGCFFHQQTPAALIAAVQSFDAARFDPARIRRHAEGYDVPVFQRRLAEFVEATVSETQGRPPTNGRRPHPADLEDAPRNALGEPGTLGLRP
ncbi:MAG: glycosyltransferase [Chloroflexota bacterium]|nr:glycosyltransferase [Chloroflexota bacterium]